MIFQALIQVTGGESNIVLHWAVIRMLEMQQVHGTLGRHRNMITRDDAREQVGLCHQHARKILTAQNVVRYERSMSAR